MIPLIALGIWLACGGLGAWLGARHWHRVFNQYPGWDDQTVITFFAGPIGLLGVLLYIEVMSDRP
jgi:hypothetical protein